MPSKNSFYITKVSILKSSYRFYERNTKTDRRVFKGYGWEIHIMGYTT